MDDQLATQIAQQQHDLLHALADNEEAISRFYEALARRFLEQREFWKQLAAEEMNHAALFRRMAAELVERKACLRGLQGFGKVEVARETAMITQRTEHVKQTNVSLKSAINVAIGIERSLIESSFFTNVSCSDPALDQSIRRIAADTNEHFDRIEMFWRAHST